MESKYKIVLVRHGQSTWNLENRFTGWTDVGLTEQGMAEAHTAGQLMRDNKFSFDIAYTSVLKRALQNSLDHPSRNGSGVDPGGKCLAA